ncbi:hypothetical protein OS493_019233 [Desmophyllum pertusum]|uniref:Uncharacterized protein n=1 Tax=Desmophyllum pertusum TaxID=174260 RepID=A0A9W9YBM1_9CNID|nr:hypothetical protein OS493_019233 [Desmophyllum pertusum]
MESTQGQRDAISRVKTDLDKILEETEYALKTSKKTASSNSLDRLNARQTRKDKQSLAEATARRPSKFEVVNVLLQILQKQEELTVEEYTINNSTIKVLVIEDTEL